VSVVSAGEIALQPELSALKGVARWFREAARHLEARILPVRLEHIAALEIAAFAAPDPCDRLVIAQALARLPLVTADEAIAKYAEAQCSGTRRGAPADPASLWRSSTVV
jgi:PIN domain nuclease of toxin-antitoxin system